MPKPDAKTAAQQLLKIGLVDESQLDDALQELGEKGGEVEPLLGVLERKGYLTPWQSGKFLKGDRQGFILGGYRVLYKIASGTFGRVFRAQDPVSGRVVAIKVLRRRWSEDQTRIDLFIREGQVGMSLHHPNIVEILAVNVDRDSGQYYIVMEFVEGPNLRELLGIRKKLEPLEALRIMEDCANGLAHASTHGVTHRDIKLTNILISSQGPTKLVDFGLAKMISSLAGKDEDKVERTVDYAGLERATNVKVGDQRSDIYFLGCVLYHILSGRSPLEMMRDHHARMQKQRFSSVQPLTAADVRMAPSVFRLVETSMELNPQRRYQTPSQLLDAVRGVRLELESRGEANKNSGPRSVFVVERDERLQDALREKLKEQGYRVFLAKDPVRALDRFRLQPFDGLVVDAGTTGEEGIHVFELIATEAERQSLVCAVILILSEGQEDWAKRIRQRSRMAVMVRPVTIRQLLNQLNDLVLQVEKT
jgi:serine/threonine protein kinase